MKYAFGARIDDDSNMITVIDEEQCTAETSGYINGVPFDSGGGSSDFSTAEVTIINNNNSEVWFIDGIVVEADQLNIYGFKAEPNTTETVEILLYKNQAYMEIGDGFTYSLSGDITEVEASKVMITGDGTITIS